MTAEERQNEIRTFLDYMSGVNRKPGSERLPAVRPRDSASLIILDNNARSPKVLMGRRNPNIRFMPGVFVFPGGSVEASDRRMNVAGMLSARAEEALNKSVVRASPLRGRTLALAAIRETYEETGLMIGSRQYGAPTAPESSLWEKFAEAGVFPDIEPFSFVARAITPPIRPKRFDTRFFVVDHRLIADRHEGFTGPECELTELVWVPLKDAESFDMAMITRAIISELRARIEAGMSELLPVPFYHVVHRKARRDLL